MTSSRQRRNEKVTPTQHRTVFTIRPARLADLPALRRLRGETARLDMPEGVVAGLRPTRSALLGMIPRLGRSVTLVLFADGLLSAYVQAGPHPSHHTWGVRYLAYGRKDRVGSAETRDAMWGTLLDAVTRVAGRRQATRLFARAPDNADAMIALRHAGYLAYGRETLYVAPYHKTVRAESGELPLRRQQSGDTWAIHQLYTLTTPKAMQFAEARTSSYWDLPVRGGTQAAYWIGREAHEITAYARTLSGEHTHLVEILFRPEEREPIVPFVRGVLAALPAGEGDLIYCRVLGFQEDLGGMLEMLGFSQLTRQSLLVKYTTITAREAVPAFARLPARTRVAARRVPSLSARRILSLRLRHRLCGVPLPTHDGDAP